MVSRLQLNCLALFRVSTGARVRRQGRQRSMEPSGRPLGVEGEGGGAETSVGAFDTWEGPGGRRSRARSASVAVRARARVVLITRRLRLNGAMGLAEAISGGAGGNGDSACCLRRVAPPG